MASYPALPVHRENGVGEKKGSKSRKKSSFVTKNAQLRSALYSLLLRKKEKTLLELKEGKATEKPYEGAPTKGTEGA